MISFLRRFLEFIKQSSILVHFTISMGFMLLIFVLVITYASNDLISNILQKEFKSSQESFLIEVEQNLVSKSSLLEKSLKIFANDYRIQNFTNKNNNISDTDVLLFFDELIDFYRYEKFRWSVSSFSGNFIDEIYYLNSREDLFRRKIFFEKLTNEDKFKYRELKTIKEVITGKEEVLWSPLYYNYIEGSKVPTNNMIKHPITNLFLHQITVARKVTDRKTGESLGVIAANIKLYNIVELLKGLRNTKNEHIFLLNKNYRIIASNTNFTPLSQINFSLSSNKTFYSNPDGIQYNGLIEKEPSFIMKKTLPINNWTLVSAIPTSLLKNEVVSFQRVIISIGIIIFIIALLISFLLSKQIIRPLNSIIAFMDKNKVKMDSDWNPPNKNPKEIVILGRSLQQMLNRIHELNDAIAYENQLKRKAELKALRLQINPHFIYNSLDSIRWLSRSETGKNEVEELIRNLTLFFKLGLSEGRTKIPIKDEIDHLDSYLKVQKLRYKDKLKYLFDIDDDVYNLLTMKIILQPIVENAIYHGINKIESGGFIRISIRVEENNVIFEIIDNGPGMDKKTLEKIRNSLLGWKDEIPNNKSNSGIGLFNVNARLKLYYGEKFGLLFNSVKNKGSKVTLKIPVERK